MKGKTIIKDFENSVKEKDPELLNNIQVAATIAQMKMFDIHARAMGCFCECLGMNGENSIAACKDYQPPFDDNAYVEVAVKWGVADDAGKPLI